MEKRRVGTRVRREQSNDATSMAIVTYDESQWLLMQAPAIAPASRVGPAIESKLNTWSTICLSVSGAGPSELLSLSESPGLVAGPRG
jgi:hypothetical protein